MRARLLISLGVSLALASAAAAADPSKASPAPPGTKNVPRDMKPYFVAFLVAGPKYTPEKTPERMELLGKHLAFIRKMIEQKRLRLAGPFADDGKVFGIAILAATSVEEATAWLEEDPAVQAGVFAHEVHPAFLPSLDGLRVRY